MEKKEMEYNEALYEQFFSIVGSAEEGKKISQSAAAKQLGYSSSVVSRYKNKTYAGAVKPFEEAVAAWLGRVVRRGIRLDVPTTETAAMDSIRKALAIAQDEADIAVIVGESGTGKTTAVRRYVEESKSAILIEVDSSFTKNVLVAEIARACGVEQKGGLTTVIGRIVEALRGRDTVVIIDEADYLSDACLELVRRVINDKAGCGAALVGLPRLEYKLRNLRNDHDQLRSRVGVLLKIKKLTRQDAAKIITRVWGEMAKEITDAFCNAAAGSVRTLVKLMGRVHQVREQNRLEKIDVEVIAAAGEMLMR
jgi:DNA transposition AAA+ family ATPase